MNLNHLGLRHAVSLNIDAELDVVAAVVLVDQVRERSGVYLLSSTRLALERLEGHGGDDPGGNRRGPVLGSEGAQGNVLPLLDVAGAPVVHDNKAEDAILGLVHGDLGAGRVGWPAHENCHLQLEVAKAAGTVGRSLLGLSGVLLELPAGANDSSVGPRQKNGRSAAVVPNRKVEPVGLKRVVGAAELN